MPMFNQPLCPANDPDQLRHTFAGDATGTVGGSMAPAVAPDTLPHAAQTPDAHQHNPGLPPTEIEDRGWVKEGQGSVLAWEREGVPEDQIPENMAESAAAPIRKVP